MQTFKEPVDSLFDYWDGNPETDDPAMAYDYYQDNHSDEYMHMASSNDETNHIDFENGTITIDSKKYEETNMQLIHENNHVYLLVNDQKILIKWLDDYVGQPYIY